METMLIMAAVPALLAAIAWFAEQGHGRTRSGQNADSRREDPWRADRPPRGDTTDQPGMRTDKGPGEIGQAGKGGDPLEAVNAVCPMDHGRVDPKAPRRHYRGEILGFCCEACAQKWDALSEEEKLVHLQAVDEQDL